MADGTELEDPGPPRVPAGPAGALELLAFLCELGMLVVLTIAGWALGNGGLMGIAFAIFYPALAILMWSLWMAPRSTRRLRDPWRLVAQLSLFAGTALLAVTAGHAVLGLAFAAIAAAAFVSTRLTGGVTGS